MCWWVDGWGIIHEGREGCCLKCDFWDCGMDRIWGIVHEGHEGARRELLSEVVIFGIVGWTGFGGLSTKGTKGREGSCCLKW